VGLVPVAVMEKMAAMVVLSGQVVVEAGCWVMVGGAGY